MNSSGGLSRTDGNPVEEPDPNSGSNPDCKPMEEPDQNSGGNPDCKGGTDQMATHGVIGGRTSPVSKHKQVYLGKMGIW